jgi:tetratricopeptide (TPR) repeat protein
VESGVSGRSTARAVLVAVLVAAVTVMAGAGPRAAQPASVDQLIDEAYEAVYNLDHPEAVRLAEEAVALAPGESRAHRTLASITWLHILFRRGAVTVDHYMGSVTRGQKNLPKPPPDQDARFRHSIEKAIELAEAALRRDSRDVQARYDAGTAYGLLASYTASVEGSMTAAFRTARRAFDAQERVMEEAPSRVEAGVVVGTYRYLVSTLAVPTRLIAYVAGFGGGKERGIAMLEAAMNSGAHHVEAGGALMLIYSREGRHADALAVALRLEKRYPKNRLFTLEAGAAAIRAGRAEEAEAILTRGLARLEGDPRPRIPGERAIWLYKRGAARIQMNHPAAAQADLDAAVSLESPGWIEGRIRIERGKLHDLAGRREQALGEYRQARELCRAGEDRIGERDAERWIRRPFSLE